jgi:hypothetical protein
MLQHCNPKRQRGALLATEALAGASGYNAAEAFILILGIWRLQFLIIFLSLLRLAAFQFGADFSRLSQEPIGFRRQGYQLRKAGARLKPEFFYLHLVLFNAGEDVQGRFGELLKLPADGRRRRHAQSPDGLLGFLSEAIVTRAMTARHGRKRHIKDRIGKPADVQEARCATFL